MPNWVIVERVKGHVETIEVGQENWSPVFRSRRLDTGAKLRTLHDSVARLNFYDETSIRIGSHLEVNVADLEGIVGNGQSYVMVLRGQKIWVDIQKAFGKQTKFDITRPGCPIAARG